MVGKFSLAVGLMATLNGASAVVLPAGESGQLVNAGDQPVLSPSAPVPNVAQNTIGQDHKVEGGDKKGDEKDEKDENDDTPALLVTPTSTPGKEDGSKKVNTDNSAKVDGKPAEEETKLGEETKSEDNAEKKKKVGDANKKGKDPIDGKVVQGENLAKSGAPGNGMEKGVKTTENHGHKGAEALPPGEYPNNLLPKHYKHEREEPYLVGGYQDPFCSPEGWFRWNDVYAPCLRASQEDHTCVKAYEKVKSKSGNEAKALKTEQECLCEWISDYFNVKNRGCVNCKVKHGIEPKSNIEAYDQLFERLQGDGYCRISQPTKRYSEYYEDAKKGIWFEPGQNAAQLYNNRKYERLDPDQYFEPEFPTLSRKPWTRDDEDDLFREKFPEDADKLIPGTIWSYGSYEHTKMSAKVSVTKGNMHYKESIEVETTHREECWSTNGPWECTRPVIVNNFAAVKDKNSSFPIDSLPDFSAWPQAQDVIPKDAKLQVSPESVGQFKGAIESLLIKVNETQIQHTETMCGCKLKEVQAIPLPVAPVVPARKDGSPNKPLSRPARQAGDFKPATNGDEVDTPSRPSAPRQQEEDDDDSCEA